MIKTISTKIVGATHGSPLRFFSPLYCVTEMIELNSALGALTVIRLVEASCIMKYFVSYDAASVYIAPAALGSYGSDDV